MPAAARDIVVVHTSDLHVDHEYTAHVHGGDGTGGLASVLNAAREMSADVVMLCGDTFDCHRLPEYLLDRTAKVIAAAGIPVVLLPGNHDPAVDDAVFHHHTLARVEIAPEEMNRAFSPETSAAISQALKLAGFTYVALDLEGYRQGSLNETLPQQKRS